MLVLFPEEEPLEFTLVEDPVLALLSEEEPFDPEEPEEELEFPEEPDDGD
ncbi:hypothetical protein LEP1GSC168_0335 [Leptospira santarosai str. HAI134]|nr:hypothetical protein LEP1GSC168_0335 [Leptospira santarosai str. HAI134]